MRNERTKFRIILYIGRIPDKLLFSFVFSFQLKVVLLQKKLHK